MKCYMFIILQFFKIKFNILIKINVLNNVIQYEINNKNINIILLNIYSIYIYIYIYIYIFNLHKY